MVKLNNKKMKWSIDQILSCKKTTSEIAEIYGVTQRWIQILMKNYKKTKKYPKMNKQRRPKTELTDQEKALIDKAIKESYLTNAVVVRLYIAKKHNKKIPYNKIHKYMLKSGSSFEEPKKQKQRKYCKYERDHSFSLVHMDWHESKVVEGKQVCVVIDDASRKVICGGEFDSATGEQAIQLMKKAIKIAFDEYSSVIRECNTDKGSQFYCNKNDSKGNRGRAEFELFLEEQGINHIPSRRNHPQTNGKNERWFRTYNENRARYKSFKDFVDWYNDKIHLGLSRKEGITPNEAIGFKLQSGAVLGLLFRRFE
jgi:putative transposase